MRGHSLVYIAAAPPSSGPDAIATAQPPHVTTESTSSSGPESTTQEPA